MSKKQSRSTRRYSATSEESVDSAEELRRQDLKERDEFANRLRKKDEGKTRKLVEVTYSNPRIWNMTKNVVLYL